MVNFKEMLETMKKNGDSVNVYVSPEQPNKWIYTGLIEDVGEDCVVMTPTKGKYNAVIPLDKIVMVEIASGSKK